MMETITSKISQDKILHLIVRKEDAASGRLDVVPNNNFIQCAILNMGSGKTFKPHKHIWKAGCSNVIAQESWVVIRGKVRCIFYDIDNAPLHETVLNAGDASFTLEGGHNYECLEDDTLVYEYKTGPYQGQALDKEFI